MTLPNFDDLLARELERIARPADRFSVLERVQGRRARRVRARKTTRALLAVVVIGATVVGFSLLTDLFDPDQHGPMATTPYGAEGAIVTCGDGSVAQICRIGAQALARGVTDDDLVRLTDFSDGQVTAPAVSPDGTTVVFERHLVGADTDRIETAELWTVGVDGTGLHQLTTPGAGFIEPSWSTTGQIVAVARDVPSLGAGPSSLVILDTSGDTTPEPMRTIDLPGLTFPSSPQWIPGGERILFAARAGSITDLYTIATDGSELTNVTNGEGHDYFTPRLSPDGRSIAFWVGSPNGVEIRICALECVDPRPLSGPDGRPIYGASPAWSPDGHWISFVVETGPRSDLHVARIDGSDERTLVDGLGEIAWIPAATEGTTITPEPEPSPTPSAESGGREIGLGFNVCNLQRLSGIDFFGDGTEGQAWTGARVRENGACPEPSLGETYLVAVDVDGDGAAEAASDTVKHCFFCRPFAVVDFDIDGAEELVVMASEGSTPTFMIYGMDGVGDGLAIAPLPVAEPGHPEARHEPGSPLTFSTGGDEGYAGWVGCDGRGGELILEIRWRDHPIEGDVQEIHETGLALRDGRFHVVSANDYSAATGTPVAGASNEPACGVDWQI
jgi:hypothetical protein